MVKTVVLIDDDSEDIEIMVEAVRNVNPQVECVMFFDPCEAVTALRNRLVTPELIIIDLTMPGLSGLDCLKQLKALEISDGIKFVMYSSAVPTQQLLDSLTLLGASAFQKPSSIKELDIIIGRLMQVA